MSQPSQSGYGRYQSYGNAPIASGGGGSGGGHGGYAGPPSNQSFYPTGPSDAPYPPSNGPQPFYFIPPSQQGQGGPQSYQPKQDNASHDDLYAAPPQQTNTAARPASMSFDPRPSGAQGGGHPGAGPQELGTSSFDSPVVAN